MGSTDSSLLCSLASRLHALLRSFLLWVLSAGPIPTHIAIIMDGNRRFADRLGIDRRSGHSHGYDSLMRFLKDCFDFRVRIVTLYAFSIDNFQRPPQEVSALMELMQTKLEALVEKEELVRKYGVQVRVIGDLSLLPDGVRRAAERAMDATKNNRPYVLNLCVSYTSSQEIVHSIQSIRNKILSEVNGSRSTDVSKSDQEKQEDNLIPDGGRHLSNLIGLHKRTSEFQNGFLDALPCMACSVCTNCECHSDTTVSCQQGGAGDLQLSCHNGDCFFDASMSCMPQENGDSDGIGNATKLRNRKLHTESSLCGLSASCQKWGNGSCKGQGMQRIQSESVKCLYENDRSDFCASSCMTKIGQVCFHTSPCHQWKSLSVGSKPMEKCRCLKFDGCQQNRSFEGCEGYDCGPHYNRSAENRDSVCSQVTEEEIQQHLYTESLPPPDILIRTSGETRLSNFLLWQSSFSHLAFCKVLWPEFSFRHLLYIIMEYQIAYSSLLQKQHRELVHHNM